MTVADARGFCEFVCGQSAHRLHVVDFKERRHPIKAAACGLHLENAATIALAHLVDLAAQGHLRLIDERDVVADVFNRRHVVGGENDGGTFVAQTQYLTLENLGVHGVEAREGFVENHELRLMEHGDDKLHLLLHTLRELFQFFVPPGHDVQTLKPVVQAFCGFRAAQSFEHGQINGLFANLHFLVEAAFFR